MPSWRIDLIDINASVISCLGSDSVVKYAFTITCDDDESPASRHPAGNLNHLSLLSKLRFVASVVLCCDQTIAYYRYCVVKLSVQRFKRKRDLPRVPVWDYA